VSEPAETDAAVSEAAGPGTSNPRIVALGGGHGLHASLTALRRITRHLTAVVTVADDGGSSGRIRRELRVLPPGDLRMALVALAGPEADHARWAETLQHRLGGDGVLAGHPVGNLMLTGLLERHRDPVAALAEMGRLVGAVGRVLPMSPIPLDLIGEADRFDPADPDRSRNIRGQSSIAATPGRVRAVRLLPAGAPACAAAVDAVREADAVVLGPGSWFTSVIPHLLLRELGRALVTTKARIIVTLNLVPQVGETDQYRPDDLLRLLRRHAEPLGDLRIDVVLADVDAVLDPEPLADYVVGIGARLILSRLASEAAPELHDPILLGEAISAALGGGSRS
jgi:uncharacterized cofD-like protein